MVLDVLFYSDTANPNGYAPDWPAQVREKPDGAPAPQAPWVRKTVDEYNTIRAAGEAAAATISRSIKSAGIAQQRRDVARALLAPVQQAAVPDSAGGIVVDIQARAAVNDLLAKLRAAGLIST